MAIYIEHWEVMDNSCGDRIDFAYTDEQREQGIIGYARYEHFKENGTAFFVRLLSVDIIGDESQSGYCNECEWYEDKQVCGRCRSRNLYASKDEPQTEREGD